MHKPNKTSKKLSYSRELTRQLRMTSFGRKLLFRMAFHSHSMATVPLGPTASVNYRLV